MDLYHQINGGCDSEQLFVKDTTVLSEFRESITGCADSVGFGTPANEKEKLLDICVGTSLLWSLGSEVAITV